MEVPTIKVRLKKFGSADAIINKPDYNPEEHELVAPPKKQSEKQSDKADQPAKADSKSDGKK